MRRRDLLLGLGAGAAAPWLLRSGRAWAATDVITDSAGRRVDVPATVRQVFPAGPPAAIFLYMFAPDLMSGWPRPPHPDEAAVLPEKYRNLPTVGRLTGRGGSANLETVLRLGPDLILDYGSLLPTYVSLADRVQQQTRIPYALLDGRFDHIPAAFRTLGTLTHRQAHAETLATEAETIIAELAAVRAKIPADARPRVYYGRGADGLETGLDGSINIELLKYAGGINVAAAAGKGGLTRVSQEQVLAWDPDVILTTDPNFYDLVWGDPIWRTLRAVKAGRVYLSPTVPFGWFDRPPSANRLIGLRWLLAVLYPDRFAARLEEQTRRFYKLFYHVDLTPRQLTLVLAPGTRPGTGRSK